MEINFKKALNIIKNENKNKCKKKLNKEISRLKFDLRITLRAEWIIITILFLIKDTPLL